MLLQCLYYDIHMHLVVLAEPMYPDNSVFVSQRMNHSKLLTPFDLISHLHQITNTNTIFLSLPLPSIYLKMQS